MFICTSWLYSRHKASVQVMKYMKQIILFYKFYKNFNIYHACVFGTFRYRQGYSLPLIKFNILELTQILNMFLLESVSFSVEKTLRNFSFENI